MAQPTRVGIVGLGNLGRGVLGALPANPDLELRGVFTRRNLEQVEAPSGTPVLPASELDTHRSDIDVLLLCGGSRDDLPHQGPELAAQFTTVDSFDTHAKVPEYFAAMDTATRAAGTIAIISAGWDPGMFSLNRLLGEALLPRGETYSFWGRGLSQGHSAALRRVPGVADGVQYTIPAQPAIEAVRAGRRPVLSTRQKHTRECFVVLAEGADPAEVEQAITTMPHYFADYDTTVRFITAEELRDEHHTMPHGGFVIRSGTTAQGQSQLSEYRLALESNPDFTASVLLAYARAAARLSQRGEVGARTVLDVPPALLSPKSGEQLRSGLL